MKTMTADFLELIINNEYLHARWINTLSYLENCGARMIAASEHPTEVNSEVLKHAAEEFRHAHYLKSQIQRVTRVDLTDYKMEYLLGRCTTRQYLLWLNVYTCKMLRQNKLPASLIHHAAYYLVTYAIECRAGELYPLYETCLRRAHSKVTVKSILLEEKEHLAEMREQLYTIPDGFIYAAIVCGYEAELYKKWITSVAEDVLSLNQKMSER